MKIKNSFRGGRVNIPSSKSYHHRYLIANALSILQKSSISEELIKEEQREVQRASESLTKLQNSFVKTNKYSSEHQDIKDYVEIKSIGICDDVLATIDSIRSLGILVEIVKEETTIIRLATKLPFVKQEHTSLNSPAQIENALTEGEYSVPNPYPKKVEQFQNSDNLFELHELPNVGFCNRMLNKYKNLPDCPANLPSYFVNVQESGSTLRFLIPICIAFNLNILLDGKGTLTKRPLDDYIRLFKEKKIIYRYHGSLPIYLAPDQAHKLTGELKISTQISSQFLSGLLFACPLLKKDSMISVESELKSADYINMTLNVLNQFGITVKREDSDKEKIFKIRGNQSYQSKDVFVEGDYSCAAFLIAAGILSKEIHIGNLNPHSLQGDRKLIDLLKSAGADIQLIEDYLQIRPSNLNAVEIDAQSIIDSVPILCVLFSTAKGRTEIYNVKRLKAKESDRIKSSLDMISSLGGIASYHKEKDCIIIDGVKQLRGGFVRTYSDHRIAMSAAIAALICKDEVEIDDYQCVSKSYTDFFHDFKKLGGDYVI